MGSPGHRNWRKSAHINEDSVQAKVNKILKGEGAFPSGPVALNAGGLGLIPEQVTRSHMPRVLQWKTLHASTETWHSQINNT